MVYRQGNEDAWFLKFILSFRDQLNEEVKVASVVRMLCMVLHAVKFSLPQMTLLGNYFDIRSGDV